MASARVQLAFMAQVRPNSGGGGKYQFAPGAKASRLICLSASGQPGGGMDIRGGAVCHIRAISAVVRA